MYDGQGTYNPPESMHPPQECGGKEAYDNQFLKWIDTSEAPARESEEKDGMATGASSWGECNEEHEDIALGATIGIIRRHERKHGESKTITVQRKRGGRRNKNRMNQVVMLNLQSKEGTSRDSISLPR
jgi:hypothetical protein